LNFSLTLLFALFSPDGYTAKDIRYVRGRGDESVSVTKFSTQEDYSNMTASISEKTTTLSTGEYSRLVMEIMFKKMCK